MLMLSMRARSELAALALLLGCAGDPPAPEAVMHPRTLPADDDQVAEDPSAPGTSAAMEPLDEEGSPASAAVQADDAPAPLQPAYPRIEATQIPGPPVRVRNGFLLAESPVWDRCTSRLYFTDVDRNVIHELGPEGAIRELMKPSGHANGMALHHEDGSLVLAEMGGGRGGRVSRRAPDGKVTVLADENASGGAFRTPDDVVVRSDGTVFFSDADFTHGPYRSVNLGARPVYILKPGATTVVRGPSVAGPNGIELSPDEKILYLSSYFDDTVYKYAVAVDGSLTRIGPLATRLNKSDSLCLDAAGNVYVGTDDGLQVLRPDGSKVKLLPIRSGDGTTNCTFGGADGRTLYITSFEALWKVEAMPVPGLDYVKDARLRGCPTASSARFGQ